MWIPEVISCNILRSERKSWNSLIEKIVVLYEQSITEAHRELIQEEWGKLIGDVPSATAILDRFLHHAEIILIKGRSYRLKDRGCKTAQEG